MARRGSRVGVNHVAQHSWARLAGRSAHCQSPEACGYCPQSATGADISFVVSACRPPACRAFVVHACSRHVGVVVVRCVRLLAFGVLP